MQRRVGGRWILFMINISWAFFLALAWDYGWFMLIPSALVASIASGIERKYMLKQESSMLRESLLDFVTFLVGFYVIYLLL
ncbi:hypothetical protein [Thermococcus sp.]|uniref:hypothetical protein n=1 Tax=Thermococcus sp. TaxID=35749 RepID=UPI00261A0801|nr:hypothetical protein [Thermococcus sp.]